MTLTPSVDVALRNDDGSTGAGRPGVLSLPDEVLVHIVRHLEPRDMLRYGAVCRRFAAAAAEDRLVWAPICAAILGPEVAQSPHAWDLPSFRRLYCDLLRPYGHLLRGPWLGACPPMGSLLIVFPDPPALVGAIVASLRLAEPGASAVPVFRIQYEITQHRPVVRCLRAANSYRALVRRTRQALGVEAAVGSDDNVPAGAVSFRIYLDRPSAQAGRKGTPLQLPPDYVTRADIMTQPGPGSAGLQLRPVVQDAFQAQGQVAGGGFEDPNWIDAEAVVLEREAFGLLWHGIRSFSAFRRLPLRVCGDEGA
ncbi:hypothetical protein GPECTOR_78g48 [Gonium pectorale]|uniref:F-box domain-containing protein n=1 Tax=Gonium pectorale TaxID=33097 RepID=A0A150G227_GONPE|nr:hypothetical protein GPECTOR_78g48 [Gonium pectorale]|eukprot:KXZ43861.1 hypothetical protein GPECTOR_78g48 [Gonium pectorale]